MSNYARPGAESRHNLSYWRYEDYAGIGPGAHGRVTVDGALRATRRHRAPEAWAGLVEREGHGTVEETPVVPAEAAREALLMGLRLAEGVDAARFASRTGVALDAALDQPMAAAAADAGYLVREPGRLRATAAGRLRLDSLLAAIVA